MALYHRDQFRRIDDVEPCPGKSKRVDGPGPEGRKQPMLGDQ
jgi:hypothetical protein